MKFCVNHNSKKAFSICHGCGKDYCDSCLDEGIEFYYCKNPECQKILREELTPRLFTDKIICPNCSCELELTIEERTSRKENYVELLSSFNLGDIGLIKSILDDSEIDYYVFGENFLAADPLIQPVRFFVNESQLEEAKEVLKDIKLNFWGYSKNQY